MYEALLLAADELNAPGGGGVLGRPIELIHRDPGSLDEEYARLAEQLISQEKVQVLFGCWSSSSRKLVGDVAAKFNNLLIYSSLSEGLEEHPNVVYVGGAPNQQLHEAANWSVTLPQLRRRKAFLVGSDYGLYSMAAHEILKGELKQVGAAVVGDEYVAEMGDFGPVAKKIQKSGADVIFNTVDGQSNQNFFGALKRAGVTPQKVPTIWLGIGEEEMGVIGLRDLVGDFSINPYFESIATPENQAFVKRYQDALPRPDADQRLDGGQLLRPLPLEAGGGEGRDGGAAQGAGGLPGPDVRRAGGPDDDRPGQPVRLAAVAHRADCRRVATRTRPTRSRCCAAPRSRSPRSRSPPPRRGRSGRSSWPTNTRSGAAGGPARPRPRVRPHDRLRPLRLVGAVLSFRGTVLPAVLGRVGLLTGLCLALALLDEYVLTRFGYPLPALDQLGHAVLGTALGLFVVFRTNTAFARFWEARSHWGGIVNGSRNLARAAAAHAGPADDLGRLIAAYALALKTTLRGGKDFTALRPLVPEQLYLRIGRAADAPGVLARGMSDWIAARLAAGRLPPPLAQQLESLVCGLTNEQGGCEKIRRTPLPFVYASLIKLVILLYLLSLPFVLVAKMGFAAPLVLAVVSLGFLGIEEAGVEIENPFGTEPNSLNLDAICDTIAENVAEATGG